MLKQSARFRQGLSAKLTKVTRRGPWRRENEIATLDSPKEEN